MVAAVLPRAGGLCRGGIDLPSPTEFLLQRGLAGSVYRARAAELSIYTPTVLQRMKNLSRLPSFALKKKKKAI